MHKIKIVDINLDTDGIETEMSFIPRKGDLIGYWVDGEWMIQKVNYIVHEFNKENIFIRTEVSTAE